MQLWIDLGANLAPFWRGFGGQVGAKLAPKSIQEAIKKSIKCCIHFISIFHRFWCPTCPQTSPYGSILAPNWVPRGRNLCLDLAAFWALGGSWAQDGPRWPQDPSKTPQGTDFDGFWTPTWRILGPNLVGFGAYFGWFWYWIDGWMNK